MAGHVFSALSVLVLASGTSAEKWWENTVIYQVYPLSFYDSNGDGIGDLRGIEEKASYLAELGVGAVWLNPFYKSPKVDNGYDISDFRDIDPQYGTMEDFERMLRTFRDKYGIEIIIDFVPNHTSDQHEWFKKSIKKEGKYTDYYIWKDPIGWDNGKPIPPNKWIIVPMLGGTSAWEWSEERRQFYYHAFYKEQPDLNFRNPDVIEEIRDLFQFWLEKGVKGFRIDAVPFIFEDEDLTDESFYGEQTQSLPEAYELVEDMRAFVDEYGEEHNVDIMLMTEACVKPDMVLKYFGTPESPGAHIPFNFLLLTHFKEQTNAHGLNNTVAGYLGSLKPDQMPNWVSGNHDMVRIQSRMGSATDVDLVNMLNLLLPGTSTVYYGDEIGMDSYQRMDKSGLSAKLQEDYRTPHRTPFQWSDEKNAGFTKSDTPWLPVHPDYYRVNVVAQNRTSCEPGETTHLKNFMKMVELKRTNLAFRKGKVSTYVLDDDVFAFVRAYGRVVNLVVFNLSKSQSKPINLAKSIPVAKKAKLENIEVKSVNMPRDLTTSQLFPGDFTMPPRSGLVLSFRLTGLTARRPLDLYYVPISGPCRGAMLAAKLLGVDLNLKLVDLPNKEQMKPEFLRMNPQHTVPTLDDNGFYLSESRAIITYLANRYGKCDTLYPKDPIKRAMVDQRLYFDMGTLFQRFGDYWFPYMFAGAPKDAAKLAKLEEAFGFFDTMLEGSIYAAGDTITVADAALAASVSTIEAVGVVDVNRYPNVSRWYRKCKATLPDYQETNEKGALAFKQFADLLINKRKFAGP